MSTEHEATGSPIDRSKRPRLEDEDWDSDYERDGHEDRHPKRQAVPDPETKAPHFAGSTDNEQQENDSKETMTMGTRSSRRKKWEEHGGSQDSDEGEDEVHIVLEEDKKVNQGGDSCGKFPGAESSSASSTTATTSSNAISLRSLVSTKDAGVIIGRGGKNVSEIRELSAARVTISDIVPGAYERILTVSGPVNAVAKAYSLVAEKILQEMPPAEDGQEQTLTIRLLVADNRMGTLIGRGGSVIRCIQEQSGARVNASEEPLPMSTERTVTIVGTTKAVQSAIQQISVILAEHPERQGSTSNTIQYRPQPQGAMMPGRAYHAGLARSAAGATAAMAGSMSPYGAMMGHMGGMPMGGASPQFYYQAAAAAAAASAYGAMPGVTGRQADYGMANMLATSQAQQIFIPNEMVGCIIGKGGSKINEIRQLSGSHIKIADAHGNTNERLVTITGTPESNQMALYLLYSRLESEKGRLGLH